MGSEQEQLLEGINIAIQMETDGKQYYLKMSQTSANKRGKELFRILAIEEDRHIADFKSIYNNIRGERGWEIVPKHHDENTTLKTVFSQAIEEIEQEIKALDSELDAIQVAVSMEEKSYDLYISRSKVALYESERKFYQALANEEKKHKEALLDYRKYILDPAGWLVGKTFPNLGSGYLPRSSGAASPFEW